MNSCLVALGVALLLCGRRSSRRVARARVDRLRPDIAGPAGIAADSRLRNPVRLPPVAAVAAAVLCLVWIGPVGVVWACVVAPSAYFMVDRLVARNAAGSPQDELDAIPLLLDLLAAAVRSGAPLPLALGCVAQSTIGQLRVKLNRTAALLRLGAAPAEAWAALDDDPSLAPLAAVASRSSHSGIRLADGLVRQASAVREQLQVADVNRAQRVGVVALLPLGLCFLPAFVCLGIVPIVAGVAGSAFGGLGS